VPEANMEVEEAGVSGGPAPVGKLRDSVRVVPEENMELDESSIAEQGQRTTTAVTSGEGADEVVNREIATAGGGLQVEEDVGECLLGRLRPMTALLESTVWCLRTDMARISDFLNSGSFSCLRRMVH
jgi:hypothetical protein